MNESLIIMKNMVICVWYIIYVDPPICHAVSHYLWLAVKKQKHWCMFRIFYCTSEEHAAPLFHKTNCSSECVQRHRQQLTRLSVCDQNETADPQSPWAASLVKPKRERGKQANHPHHPEQLFKLSINFFCLILLPVPMYWCAQLQ